MSNQVGGLVQGAEGNQTAKARKDTLGLVGMILGVLGVLFSFCCTFLSIFPGVAALVCGAIARNNGQRYAITAIILGIVAIVLGIILTWIGMG